jgi:hypothetical protein
MSFQTGTLPTDSQFQSALSAIWAVESKMPDGEERKSFYRARIALNDAWARYVASNQVTDDEMRVKCLTSLTGLAAYYDNKASRYLARIKETDMGMVRMYWGDAQSIRDIFKLVEDCRFKAAWFLIQRLDTAVREGIEEPFYNWLGDMAEKEGKG